MSNVCLGLDNGNGTVAIVYEDGSIDIKPTPIKKCLSYTKKVNYISRFDVDKFKDIVKEWLKDHKDWSTVKVGIERPFTSPNPLHKKGVVIGARIHEAQLIAVEQLGLGYEFVDSKSWQKLYLPSGIIGSVELKKASREIAIREYPYLANKVKKDMDALFIAKYLKSKESKVTKEL